MCELTLAHVDTNRIEAADRRTDLFERRRALIEPQAAFVAGTEGAEPGLAVPRDRASG